MLQDITNTKRKTEKPLKRESINPIEHAYQTLDESLILKPLTFKILDQEVKFQHYFEDHEFIQVPVLE